MFSRSSSRIFSLPIQFSLLLVAIVLFSGSFLSPLASGQMPEEVKAPIQLTDANMDDWRRHILPDESEMEWRKIPWLPTLAEGILKASEESKPVLLWTMNGHPLGCT